MLMFNFHTAFSLGLIALALGAAIVIWSKAHENMDMRLPKIIGYLVIIISVPNLLCTSYYAVNYKLGGHFDKPYPMMGQYQKMHKPMLLKMMMKNKEMQDRAAMMQDQNAQVQAPVVQNQEMMTQNQTGQMQPQMMQNQDGQAPKQMMQGNGMQHQNMPMMNGQMQQQEPMSSTMTPGHMQKTSTN